MDDDEVIIGQPGDLPEANDHDVERIATALFNYITGENMFRGTLKFTICEALYEMRAIAAGKPYSPTVQVIEIGRNTPTN
jgi:hypothetical protein